MYRMFNRIHFQFFAAPDGAGGSEEGNSQQNDPNQQGTQTNQQQNTQQQGTQYTQEQINTMMANEKRTARQALLKSLGIELKEGEKYEDAIKRVKGTLDAGKTQAQLDAEAKTKAEGERDEANKKVSDLETKVAALSVGAKPESLDDVITLAQAKVSSGKTIEDALKELKEKYPVLFGESDKNNGTGNSTNPPRKGANTEGLGQRLAKNSKHSVKSTYFKN